MRNQLDELNSASSSDSGLSSPSSVDVASTSTESSTDRADSEPAAATDSVNDSQSSFVSPELIRIFEDMSRSQTFTDVSHDR